MITWQSLLGTNNRRSIIAWTNETYDAIRDTWNNAMLINRIIEILNSEGN